MPPCLAPLINAVTGEVGFSTTYQALESPSFVVIHVGERRCSRLQRPKDSALICDREAPVKLAVAPGRSGLDDVADNLSTCRAPWNIFEPIVFLRGPREGH